jgi:hypothetical protein
MKFLPHLLFALPACAIPSFANVAVSTPTAGSTLTSPVHYVASATTTTCSKGVASMGIYVNNKLIYVVNGTQLNTSITLAVGPEHTVVEEWDYCGGATYATIDLTIETSAAPVVSMYADPSTITAGSATTLTVTAANSSSVIVSGNGSTYTLPPTGGRVSVSPGATATYTAEVSGSGGKGSASSTVTVIPAADLSAIGHVIFMLQENRSFDSYFGMLNPYRKANGWNIGDDGKEYDVDGIDDKLNTISNQDDQGDVYHLYKYRTSCVDDMSSAWLESYGDVYRWSFAATRPILMDGFVHIAQGYANNCASTKSCSGSFTDTTGERAMGYYDQGFAICRVGSLVLTGGHQERAQPDCDVHRRHHAGVGFRSGQQRSFAAIESSVDFSGAG